MKNIINLVFNKKPKKVIINDNKNLIVVTSNGNCVSSFHVDRHSVN